MSWLFDTVAGLVQLSAHPDTPALFRDALFPFVYALGAILEQEITLVKIHEVHGEHVGTPLEGTWKALQTQIRLQGTTSAYNGELVTETLDRIHKDLLTQQLKAVAKSEAGRAGSTSRRAPRCERTDRNNRREPRRDQRSASDRTPPRPVALRHNASLSCGRAGG